MASPFDSSKISIMGILNVTPDSFSDGDVDASSSDFIQRARVLIESGADIIDIGGESTRPGAKPVSLEEEWKRVEPVLKGLRENYPSLAISLDTKNYEIAKRAVPYQIQILNDVSFFQDPQMASLVVGNNWHYVLMHSRGTPETMMSEANYKGNLTETIVQECQEKVDEVLAAGVLPERLILDPGFGFAKTPEQCVEMMDDIHQWANLPHSLLIGISRKRFIQQYTGENLPTERDEMSAELAMKAVEAGFRIIRTHNVALTKAKLSH